MLVLKKRDECLNMRVFLKEENAAFTINAEGLPWTQVNP
jgi:hypothetical protein